MSTAALATLRMWRLSRHHGIKPWEQNGDFDDQGRAIVYKDDIDALAFLDALEEDGRAHQQWLESTKQGAGR
jgi:hypothetical protein